MKRRLFTIAAAISLLGFLITASFFFRGLRHADQWQMTHSDASRRIPWIAEILAADGWMNCTLNRVELTSAQQVETPRSSFAHGQMDFRVGHPPIGQSWYWGNFAYHSGPPPPGGRWQYVRGTFVILGFRLWPTMFLTAILPAVWLIAALRRRRQFKEGHCQVCGYDLRESKIRCPECGTAIVRQESIH